jgi:hypothetical protein
MAPVILAPDVETSREVTGVQHGVQEGGDAQASKIVTAIFEGAQGGADACEVREVSFGDIATSKEVAMAEAGAQEAADGHNLTAREVAQEGEAGDVSSTAKIVTAVQEGAQEVMGAWVAQEVSSRLREVDTSKEVAVVQEGLQEGADAQFFTAQEGACAGESRELSSQAQEVETSIEVAAVQGV